jgi:K+-transporting ATPase c subunit
MFAVLSVSSNIFRDPIQMTTFKIVPGGVYAKANEVFAREVIEITANGNVIYNDYGLSVGAPIGQSFRCSLSRFVTWAARPLTPEEISKLRRN